MNCLNNFIGVHNCTDQVSLSNLYLTDLEGISFKSISSIESGKYVTFQNMVDAKMRLVGAKLLDRLSTLLGDVYVEQSMDSMISKNFGETYFSQQDGTPGLRIEKRPTSLSKIYIPRIYFKSHLAIDTTITLSDGVNSESFDVSAGVDEEVTIETRFYSTQLRVDVTYTSTNGPSDDGVSPFTENISPFDAYYYDGCNSCCGNRNLMIHGLDFTGAEKSVYYGVRADIELICDKEKMICLIAMQNKTIFLYGLGVETLKEWIATDRFNFLAMSSKEWAKEKVIEWANEFERLWFANAQGIKNVLMSKEPKCFTCNGYKYKEIIP